MNNRQIDLAFVDGNMYAESYVEDVLGPYVHLCAQSWLRFQPDACQCALAHSSEDQRVLGNGKHPNTAIACTIARLQSHVPETCSRDLGQSVVILEIR